MDNNLSTSTRPAGTVFYKIEIKPERSSEFRELAYLTKEQAIELKSRIKQYERSHGGAIEYGEVKDAEYLESIVGNEAISFQLLMQRVETFHPNLAAVDRQRRAYEDEKNKSIWNGFVVLVVLLILLTQFNKC